jgi:hypothetical protein
MLLCFCYRPTNYVNEVSNSNPPTHQQSTTIVSVFSIKAKRSLSLSLRLYRICRYDDDDSANNACASHQITISDYYIIK